jgi:lysophospholipase L1-like esterase
MRMLLTTRCVLAVLAAIAATCEAQDAEPNRGDLWADDMARFEQQDTEDPREPGGVVFVGSSSIRLWDLQESFPKLDPPPLNRGFGGSQLVDSIRRAELLVIKHRPRLVVIYAGDNDIAAGKDAGRVVNDFRMLTALIQAQVPDVHIAYIAIKPSIARWKMADEMQVANGQIAKLCAENEQLTFIDVWKPMLGRDGEPREELFRDDGLHLNDKGYELWTSLVAPVIDSTSGTRD